MKNFAWITTLLSVSSLPFIFSDSVAQDWPQWRGPTRDARALGFKVPPQWPKELKEKWKVTVGDGVATPALVGDKLYVFSRENGSEVLRCLEAATGKEVWQEKYESLGATGPAQGFSGPRSSPTAAEGKVVTLGVRGVLSCFDAATGKLLWRKTEFKSYPQFYPSSSPIVVDGLCIAQLGGREDGALVAYDLATGGEKWKLSTGSPAYASPALMDFSGTKLVIARTEGDTIAVNAADGKLMWKSGASAGTEGGRARGGGRDYKAATPIVEDHTVIIAGQGIRAMKLEKPGNEIIASELWNIPDKSVIFNTPVLKNGVLYGLTPGNELFAVDTKDPQSGWSAQFPSDQAAPAGGDGQGGGRRGGRGGGFGSIVDVGSDLFVLTPSAQLLVLDPNSKGMKVLASYKVADSQTHAHPVVSGNRIFIKDQNSVALLTVD